MDDELVTSSESDKRGGVQNDLSSPHFRYTKTFEKLCPTYMSYGMSYEEYWDGDCEKAKYYKKLNEINMSKVNHDRWLQGLYVYHAILNASPALIPFNKKPEPKPYPSEPFPITDKDRRDMEERKSKEQMEANKRKMMDYKANFDKKFGKGEDTDG